MSSRNEERKVIRALKTFKTDKGSYDRGEAYSVRASLADELVGRGLVELVRFDEDEDEDDQEAAAEAAEAADKPWRQTVRPGDAFVWQVSLRLTHLTQPRIHEEYRSEPGSDGGAAHKARPFLDEVGGDTKEVSPAQARALDALAENEAAICRALLKAVAQDSASFRQDWEASDRESADRIVPRRMSQAQASQRLAFTRILISTRSRDGLAYLEFRGECAWDPDHGFNAVLHGNRLVGVFQQGAGWTDSRE